MYNKYVDAHPTGTVISSEYIDFEGLIFMECDDEDVDEDDDEIDGVRGYWEFVHSYQTVRITTTEGTFYMVAGVCDGNEILYVVKQYVEVESILKV